MKDEISGCGTWDAPGTDADQVLLGVLANADVQDAGDLPSRRSSCSTKICARLPLL